MLSEETNPQQSIPRDSIPLGTTQFVDPTKVVVKRWANGEYRQNTNGTTSTHLMSSFESDGKHYAAPTVYPKERKGTKSHDPKDWWEAPSRGFAFADTAEARGELYGPFKNQQIAKKFAANGYKNMPAQKIASGKLLKKK